MEGNNLNSKKGGQQFISMANKDRLFGIVLTLPAIAVLCITVFLPILKGIYVSFCDYKLANLKAPVWNNFENFTRLFQKGEIFLYFKITFVYVGLVVVIQFILGLMIALLLDSSIRGRNIYRGLFLIPWTIPSVVVAILWRWMLHQQFGVINYILYQFGITESVNISWTMHSVNAMAAIVIATVWRQLPYMMVMLLAGLQSVDRTLVEAAKIDGASPIGTLLHVKLPAILPVAVSSVWIAIMTNFQMYTIIKNVTGGGPVNSTTTLSIAAYRSAFQSYDFGKGAAIGVLWLIFLSLITFLCNKVNERYAMDYQ